MTEIVIDGFTFSADDILSRESKGDNAKIISFNQDTNNVYFLLFYNHGNGFQYWILNSNKTTTFLNLKDAPDSYFSGGSSLDAMVGHSSYDPTETKIDLSEDGFVSAIVKDADDGKTYQSKYSINADGTISFELAGQEIFFDLSVDDILNVVDSSVDTTSLKESITVVTPTETSTVFKQEQVQTIQEGVELKIPQKEVVQVEQIKVIGDGYDNKGESWNEINMTNFIKLQNRIKELETRLATLESHPALQV